MQFRTIRHPPAHNSQHHQDNALCMNFHHSIPIYLNIYIPQPPIRSSHLARNNLRLPRRHLGNHSVIRLIRAPRLRRVHAVLAQLPRTLHRLKDLVLGRWLVDRVGDPGVPSGLDLGPVGGRIVSKEIWRGRDRRREAYGSHSYCL
mgnify:CR=1 FL=1